MSEFEPVGVSKETSLFPTRVMDALKGLFTPADDNYTRDESDARYEPKGTAYDKATSDGRYERKGVAYSKAQTDELLDAKPDFSDLEDVVSEPEIIELARRVDLGLTRDVGPFDMLQRGVLNPLQDTRVGFIGSSTAMGMSAFSIGGSGMQERINVMGAYQRLGFAAGAREIKDMHAATSAVAPGGMQWFQGNAQRAGDLASRADNVSNVKPHYLFIQTGSNDWANEHPVANYEAEMRSAVQTFESRAPSVRIVLVQQQARVDGVKRVLFAEYGRVLERIAAESPSRVFIDAEAEFAKQAILDNNRSGLVSNDNVHMRNAGHTLLFNILCSHTGIPDGEHFKRARDVIHLPPPANTTVTPGQNISPRRITRANYARTLTFTGGVFCGDFDGDIVVHWRNIQTNEAGERPFRLGRTSRGTINLHTVVFLEPNVDYDIAYGWRGNGNVYISGNNDFTYVHAIVEAL